MKAIPQSVLSFGATGAKSVSVKGAHCAPPATGGGRATARRPSISSFA